MDDLSLWRCAGRCSHISFAVRSGEILGLAGLWAPGAPSCWRHSTGAPAGHGAGSGVRAGAPVRLRSPRDAIAAGIGFVTEDRKGQSLVLVRSVRENTSLVGLRRFVRGSR